MAPSACDFPWFLAKKLSSMRQSGLSSTMFAPFLIHAFDRNCEPLSVNTTFFLNCSKEKQGGNE